MTTESTTRRDLLALARTRLANERTLMAYVRTALSLLAAAAVLLHFFTGQSDYLLLGWLLLVLGLLGLVAGCYRFAVVRAHLRVMASADSNG